MGMLENISGRKTALMEKRVTEALKVAKKISKILAVKFGAKEVILFGSLTEGKNSILHLIQILQPKGLKINI